MARECPHCGFENPDYIVYCGQCGKSMHESDDSPVESAAESFPSTTPKDSRPRMASAFTWATFAAAAGFVAMIVGWLLNVYYYERILAGIRDIEEHISLSEISRLSYYSRSIGLALCFVAFVLAVWALKVVLADGRQTVVFQNLKARLGLLLLLGIVMAICAAIAALFTIYVSEWGHTVSDAIVRIRIYMPMFANVLAAVALLIVANALRTANRSSHRS